MKRLFCLLFCLCFLSGCSVTGERIKEPVVFYYVRDGYQKEMGSVIASEVREASGHSEDLPYLLALYSMGPSQKDLKAVLPRNTTIVPTEYTEDGIVLTLSESAMTVTDADFTVASTCIALTCMELTEVPQITVVCADRSITIQKENLLLNINPVERPQEETK